VDQKLAQQDLDKINELWSQCGIAFERIRTSFLDGSRMLSVTTGSWGGSTVGWTSMPGSAPYGAVVSTEVVKLPEIAAQCATARSVASSYWKAMEKEASPA
jgi:hypothetical protein